MSLAELPFAPHAAGGAPRLTIGLLNNMPDAALAATERQFASLLREAAGAEFDIELKLFALPDVPRGERARVRMQGRYRDGAALTRAGLDALIVTGAEPLAPDLDQEAYWPALARVIDWTQDAGMATVWSCLAAHAAVLRLSGVRRHRLAGKLSGVFASDVVWHDPLLDGAPDPIIAPHSRLNGLIEPDLVLGGYKILARSAKSGVGMFVRRDDAVNLFLQGHPEYDADTLLREYCRDMGRYLRRERETRPAAPAGYFDAAAKRALAELDLHTRIGQAETFMVASRRLLAHVRPAHTWRASAVAIYRNWLAEVAERAGVAQRARLAAAG